MKYYVVRYQVVRYWHEDDYTDTVEITVPERIHCQSVHESLEELYLTYCNYYDENTPMAVITSSGVTLQWLDVQNQIVKSWLAYYQQTTNMPSKAIPELCRLGIVDSNVRLTDIGQKILETVMI